VGSCGRARGSFRLQEAGERRLKAPAQAGRRGSVRPVERRAGPKCDALFDERSGGSGPGSRAGRPQGWTASGRGKAKAPPRPGATERVRGSSLSPLGRPKTPSRRHADSNLPSGRTVPSGARSSPRRGLRAGADRSGRCAVSASSLLLLEGPSLRFRPRAGRSPGRVCRCEPAGERRKSSELRECS